MSAVSMLGVASDCIYGRDCRQRKETKGLVALFTFEKNLRHPRTR